MKFLIAKNDNLFCFYGGCRCNILYGEHYIGIFFIDKEGVRRRLIFHVECYINWLRDNMFNKYNKWAKELTEPKKRGRPKIYKDGYEVHKMKVLLHYYKKAGNDEKVQELEAKLSELRA